MAFQLEHDDGNWSSASSLNGRPAGNHYEGLVRQRLWHLPSRKISAAIPPEEQTRLKEMQSSAFQLSKEVVGSTVWNRIVNNFQLSNRQEATADCCGKLQECREITQALGPAAKLLCGPALSLHEQFFKCTVHGAVQWSPSRVRLRKQRCDWECGGGGFCGVLGQN